MSHVIRARSATTAKYASLIVASVVMMLPLVVIQLLLRERWPGVQNLYDDWANFAYYTTYLFAGFLLAKRR